MGIKSILGATFACLAVASINANAVVLNTLNGVNYEWLELTETTGLYRNDVESRLADSNDILYGYEYASVALVEDLLHSYVSWNGVDGYFGAPNVTSGMERFMDDFYGGISADDWTGVYVEQWHGTNVTVDGYTVTYDHNTYSWFMYGDSGDAICGVDAYDSCLGFITNDYYGTYPDEFFTNMVRTHIAGSNGWDSNNPTTGYNPDFWDDPQGLHAVATASMLVKVVPIPAAIWLFGSGLIGLIGLARRKA